MEADGVSDGSVHHEGRGWQGQIECYIDKAVIADIGADIFERGLRLPNDDKMTEEQQRIIVRIIKGVFK